MPSNEIQRILLLVALGICGYLLILAWNDDYGQQNTEVTDRAAPSVGDDSQLAPAVGSGEATSPPLGADNGVDLPSLSDVPSPDLLRDTGEGAVESPLDQPAGDRLVEVSTPLLEVWIDRRGGDIVGLQLPKYPASLDRPDVPFRLLDSGAGHTYVAQSGLMGPDGVDTGRARPLYKVSRQRYRIDGAPDDVVLRYETDDLHIEKRFRFDPADYYVDVVYEIENRGSSTFRANLFTQLKHDGSSQTDAGFSLGPRPYLGAALTTEDSRYEKVDFDDLDEEEYRQEVRGGWIAMLQHYFLSAWVSEPDADNRFFGRKRNDGIYVVGFTGPAIAIAPGDVGSVRAGFYAGPKDQRRLEQIAPNLNLTVDYGFLWWLAVPLFYLLDALQSVVVNWGVAIILLTLVVKVVLFPLSAASYRSMANMRRVAPQLKRIQERYADDRQKLSQEMMGLYKKEKINPLGGCLPMVLQMPVFIALYWVLYESVELRQAPFFGWINDLAAMDPYFVLPILMGASMFVQQMLNPPVPDPMQAKVMKMMPIMFTALFLFFPSGLVLYWLVNNLLSIGQQWFITRRIENAAAA